MSPQFSLSPGRSPASSLLALAVLLALLALPGASAQEPASPAEARSPEDIKAEETFTRNCVKCHTSDRVGGSRRSRSQWEEVMTTMQTSRGAIITDEDWDVVLGYLVKHHGRVNVNRAAADDLVEVLGITPAAADAILKHRKEHGNFEDFDALAKVPGVDADRLQKLRDAISF